MKKTKMMKAKMKLRIPQKPDPVLVNITLERQQTEGDSCYQGIQSSRANFWQNVIGLLSSAARNSSSYFKEHFGISYCRWFHTHTS